MKNQVKLQKYLFTLLFILINGLLFAQFSKQQATDHILNNIIATDTVNVDVFSLTGQQSIQDSIVLYGGEKIACPYPENWVFFINDNPAANWNHPCRYLFVNAETGETSVINSRIYPMEWATNYETVNQAFSQASTTMPTNTSSITGGLAPNYNYYAVILCGADQQRYWYDISGIYNTLISVYGYTKENIFVLYGNGSSYFGSDLDDPLVPSDDIDYSANYYDVNRLFRNLSGELSDPEIPELLPGSQLFLFIDGHGDGDGVGNSYAILNDFNLEDEDLATYLENIKCSQMIIMLETCLSGGFIDDLSDYTNYSVSCKNRSVHTAAKFDGSSFAEFYMTWEGDPFMFFANEFVWYWNAAARGYFPVYDQPWLNTDVPIENFNFNNISVWTNHPAAYDPDINSDGFVQMEEAFDYTNNFDTFSQYGYFEPYTNDTEDPQEWSDISFQEDLLSLSGLVGHVSTTQTIGNRSYLIGGNFDIDPGITLTFSDGTGLYLGNENADINVSLGSFLNIGNNMEIYGNSQNRLTVDGIILFGQGVKFDKLSSSQTFGGLILNNQNASLTFNNLTFNNGQLISYLFELNIENSFINSTYLGSHRGFVNCDNSIFDGVWTYFTNTVNSLPFFSLTITNCTFKNESHAGLTIDGYPYFNLNYNHIFSCGDGIALFNSGNGLVGNQNIMSNEINNNSSTGISLYNSKVSVSSNYIYNNRFGIRIFNNSNTALYGNPGATTNNETNYITDNSSYEMYASTYSFPWYFRYNVIIDEDNLGNPTDPMVYYQPSGGGSLLIDVRYNCWGNNFSQTADLYPAGYMVDPTWCPPGGGHKSTEIALEDFLEGLDYFENGQYADARTAFQSVINLYPETPYAGSAMHELFSLEKFADNDYSTLQQYYETNDSIQADTVLTKLAVFLSNKCEIEMENWQTAIDHFEDIIENPETPEDSIFAIIDLGYTYLLMGDSGYKSTAQGWLLEHKPASPEAFSAKRDYLISLLPFEKSGSTSETLTDMNKQFELLQNVPNPFSNTTSIQFNLNSGDFSSVEIRVLDQVGKEVRHIPVNSAKEGSNTIELNMQGLPSGIYYYSLIVNGTQADTKKMVVVR